MGYSYYASATFPASARKIPAIAEYLDKDQHFGDLTEEDGGLLCASEGMASCGQLEITDLLEEYRVPYDHYHRDDNACQVWTDKYRLNDAGELVELCSVSEQDEELSNFAKKVLKAIEDSDMELAYALLNEVSTDAESIEDIAKKSDF